MVTEIIDDMVHSHACVDLHVDGLTEFHTASDLATEEAMTIGN